MGRPKKRQQRSGPQRRGTRAKTGPKAPARGARESSGPRSKGPREPDAVWESLRQGARNVAGVTYQIAVTADLLVAGRAGSPDFPSVVRVVPEGYEDVDCVLRDDRRLLVQTKERGPGANAVGPADLAAALVHAAEALTAEGNQLSSDKRFVFVTDGRLSAGVPETGWNRTVAQALKENGDDGERKLQALIDSVAQRLPAVGQPESLAEPLMAIASVVRRPWHLRLDTEQVMRDRLGLHPSVANLAYGRLVVDLSHVAAEQRSRPRTSADFRTTGDFDALIRRVQEAVDVDALDQAVRQGIAEPVDYTLRSPISESDFLAGVDVTPAHIAAGLDVVRAEELSAILNGLDGRGQVVIAGPSGSGKSALMWRAARDVGRGARPVRVLRCATNEDVTLLVRHARVQGPAAESPLLVCVDDLGRDSFTQWPAARDQLLGIPGVYVLATVRREDFTAQLAGSATVVDPKLTQQSAEAVYEQLKTAGVPLLVEPEEAIARAEGLLMEFIALATTGERLETVLAIQVERLGEPSRRLQRRCLRLVAAAHTLGSALSADELAMLLTRDGSGAVDDVSDALNVLADEHLLRPQADGSWRGLHDLRTEVLLRLLHVTPPPTLAATFAEVLPLLPPGRRSYAMRRAAERLARAAVTDTDATNPHDTVDRLTILVLPVAKVASTLIEQLPMTPPGARQAADLLDGALRADAAVYMTACLHFLEAHRPPTTELQNLAFITFSIRNLGIQMPNGLPAGERLNALGVALPAGTDVLRQAVGRGLTSSRLVAFARECSFSAAVQLLEATETIARLTPDDAASIWSHHVAATPDPPGDAFDQQGADRRAQLAATLIALVKLPGAHVADVLGPVETRAADAAASDPHSLNAAVALVEHDPSEDPDSALIRRETFAPGRLLVAHPRRLAQLEATAASSAYTPVAPEKGDASINDQAVRLARRIFDACPEVDRVDVDVLQANLQPMRYTSTYGINEEGVKRLRRGILPREPETRFNAACQAAVARFVAAGSWSERLRQQATVAQRLGELLGTALLHLRTYRNARHLRLYLERAQDVATAVAALPLRPSETGTGSSWTDELPVGGTDERDKATDKAQMALSRLSGAILQLAKGLKEDDPAAVGGAGHQLADVPKELKNARLDGAPAYAGIGDTLPTRLDELAALIADVVLAREISQAARSLLDGVQASDDLVQRALDVVAAAAREQEDVDLRTARSWLAEQGIEASAYVMLDREPLAGRLGSSQILVVIPLENWSEAVSALQGWPPEEREDLTGAVVAMPVHDGTLAPLALRTFGHSGTALPLIDATVHADAAAASGLPLAAESPFPGVIRRTVDSLFETSWERVRDARRDQRWAHPPSRSADPQVIADELRRNYSDELAAYEAGQEDATGAAVSLLLELCAAVNDEDGEEEGFAAALASIDIARLGATTNSYMQLLDAVMTLALVAGTDS
jgi:hypothetical protein